MKYSAYRWIRNYIFTIREAERYKECQTLPEEEREKITKYGRKAIVNSIVALVLPILTFALLYLFFKLVFSKEAIISGVFILWLFGVATVLALVLFSLFFPVTAIARAIKFTVWQNKLNKRTIGKVAIAFTVICSVAAVAADIFSTLFVLGLFNG